MGRADLVRTKMNLAVKALIKHSSPRLESTYRFQSISKVLAPAIRLMADPLIMQGALKQGIGDYLLTWTATVPELQA